MKKLTVDLSDRSYDILIEQGLLDRTGTLVRATGCGNRLAVITDETVLPLYGARICSSLEEAGFTVKMIPVPTGEHSKSLTILEQVYDALTDFRLTRSDAVVALGGGVVGDLAGFAAATILRGVDFIQIPTTLLAQVDSSVGGKVGIDLKAGKNLAGAFHQPRLVLIDPACLKTLSDRHFADGLAEVIKYGAIRDPELFRKLAAHADRQHLFEHIDSVIQTCCAIKRDVVVADERDTGERMLLNFGHTLGHAYELAYHYERYTHGEAVAAGMCMACALGERLGLTAPGTEKELAGLLERFGLPTRIDCSLADYQAAIGLDKKGTGDTLRLVLLSSLGHAFIHPMSKVALLELLRKTLAD